VWRFHFDPLDVGIVAAVHRCTFFHQGLEGELDVFGGYRRAIVEARLLAKQESYPGVVRRLFDLLGDQSIAAERLVHALHGQGVVDQADIVGRHALADERVETVETAKAGLTEDAAFRCIGVDVVEVLEVRRILGRFVIERGGVLRGGNGEAGKTEQNDAATVEQETAQRVGHRAFSVGFSHQVRRPSV
jgi:hypothetical protein